MYLDIHCTMVTLLIFIRTILVHVYSVHLAEKNLVHLYVPGRCGHILEYERLAKEAFVFCVD